MDEPVGKNNDAADFQPLPLQPARARGQGFQRMLDLMRRDEVGIVLASETSRLSRNPLDAEEFLWTAIRHGVLVEVNDKLFWPGAHRQGQARGETSVGEARGSLSASASLDAGTSLDVPEDGGKPQEFGEAGQGEGNQTPEE